MRRQRNSIGTLALAVAAICAPLSAQLPTPHHPLDALTSSEYWTVYDVLRASGRVDSTMYVASELLREPPKDQVLSWRPGQPMPREADVVVARNGQPIEAVVDITGRSLRSWTPIKGAWAPITEREGQELSEAVKADPRIRAALVRRGISDFSTVTCEASPSGVFDATQAPDHRYAWSKCLDRHGATRMYGHPIEGLYAVIDMESRKVLRVRDVLAIPIPQETVGFDEVASSAASAMPPLTISQPAGPGFRITDGEVAWQRWRFRFRLDPRVGPVVNLVRYDDGGRLRSILYEGSLSEIVVPYMDPDEAWSNHVFVDAGEYLAGGMLKPMREGVDCPTNAAYFGGIAPTERGTPVLRPRLACLFERATGEIAWRHGLEGSPEDPDNAGRPARTLVLRVAAVVTNYDYVFDWIFQEDGAIRIALGATGIIETKGAGERIASAAATNGGLGSASAATPAPDAYGHFVSDHLVGVNHDHFFAFRLDLDVDGPANSFVVDHLVPQRLPDSSGRRSLWHVESQIARSERDAMMDVRMDHPTMWRFINPSAHGAHGYPTGYEIVPGHTAMSLLSPDDWPERRAGFVDHQLWVTPYRRDELFAAGTYPTNSRGTDGLPVWTKANRAIENTDIVAWYTMGFHHVPRAEDWPVMPVMWHEVMIRPFDFFPHNPVLDLPLQP